MMSSSFVVITREFTNTYLIPSTEIGTSAFSLPVETAVTGTDFGHSSYEYYKHEYSNSTSTTATASTTSITTLEAVVTTIGDELTTITSTRVLTVPISRTSGAATSTPSASVGNGDSSKESAQSSFFHNRGKVAGVFTAVGVVSAFFLVIGAYFLYRRYAMKKFTSSYNDYYKGSSVFFRSEMPAIEYSDLESNGHHHRNSRPVNPTDPRLDPDSALYTGSGLFSTGSSSDDQHNTKNVLTVKNV